MSCVMPLAIALWVECLVVICVKVSISQVEVVAFCSASCLDFSDERVETEIASNNVFGRILLWTFFDFSTPATELLPIADCQLAFCFRRECANGIILGDALCADDSRAVHIIIGKGVLLLLCHVVHIYVGIDIELEEEGILICGEVCETKLYVSTIDIDRYVCTSLGSCKIFAECYPVFVTIALAFKFITTTVAGSSMHEMYFCDARDGRSHHVCVCCLRCLQITACSIS